MEKLNNRQGRRSAGSFGIYFTLLQGGLNIQHLTIFNVFIRLIYLTDCHRRKITWQFCGRTVCSVWAGENKEGCPPTSLCECRQTNCELL